MTETVKFTQMEMLAVGIICGRLNKEQGLEIMAGKLKEDDPSVTALKKMIQVFRELKAPDKGWEVK